MALSGTVAQCHLVGIEGCSFWDHGLVLRAGLGSDSSKGLSEAL